MGATGVGSRCRFLKVSIAMCNNHKKATYLELKSLIYFTLLNPLVLNVCGNFLFSCWFEEG